MNLLTPSMTLEASVAWRPSVKGWSRDILPVYAALADALPKGGTVVEVGVAYGRSVLFLAERLVAVGNATARIYAVDTWEPAWAKRWEPEARERDVDVYGEFLRNLSEAPRAERELVYVARTDRAPVDAADVVFLDGSHEKDDVTADIWRYRSRVRAAGIMAGHDYGTAHPGVKAAVDGAFGQPDQVNDSVWQVRP